MSTICCYETFEDVSSYPEINDKKFILLFSDETGAFNDHESFITLYGLNVVELEIVFGRRLTRFVWQSEICEQSLFGGYGRYVWLERVE